MNPSSSGGAGGPATTAGWFGPAGRPCFGWLHRPTTGGAVGMVIVPPFGFEAICAHRSLRALAERGANAGLTVVRFDPDGSGDSDGDDLDPDRIESWLASVDDACNLARSAGADRLVLIGVRLGAALATLAASRRQDVAGLVAINAVVRGRAFLREGRALQMALDLQPASRPSADGGRELVGFALSADTVEALSALDLSTLPDRPAPVVLLIERDDLPTGDDWAAHLRELGAKVEVQRLPGYAGMMLEPHNTVVPDAMLDAAVAFAVGCGPLEHAPSDTPATTLVPRATLRTGDGVVHEQVETINDALFAISARPVADDARRAVLLLNAGAIGHIGPNRLYVVLARQLAAAGYLVLRMDLSGLGDSAPRRGEHGNVVYSEFALDDVAVAVDWARRSGAGEVAAVGLCSGAYHALKAALAGQTIDRIGVINPLTFNYRPGMPLDLAESRVLSESRRYGTSMRSTAAWRKLLRGHVNLRYVSKIVLRRLASLVTQRARALARTAHLRMVKDLGTELRSLADRGVAIDFVFAASDPGPSMLQEQAGWAVDGLRASGALSIRIIDGADHTFTARWTQPLLLGAVRKALG